jgi:hypothetical protein
MGVKPLLRLGVVRENTGNEIGGTIHAYGRNGLNAPARTVDGKEEGRSVYGWGRGAHCRIGNVPSVRSDNRREARGSESGGVVYYDLGVIAFEDLTDIRWRTAASWRHNWALRTLYEQVKSKAEGEGVPVKQWGQQLCRETVRRVRIHGRGEPPKPNR